MYGYILAVIIGLLFLGLTIGMLSRPRPPRRATSSHEREVPSADAPTPGKSAVAPERQQREADRHTPAE